jgi:hypothetical protein
MANGKTLAFAGFLDELLCKSYRYKIEINTTLVVSGFRSGFYKPYRLDRYQFSPSFIALPSLQIQQCRFIREPSGSTQEKPDE